MVEPLESLSTISGGDYFTGLKGIPMTPQAIDKMQILMGKITKSADSNGYGGSEYDQDIAQSSFKNIMVKSGYEKFSDSGLVMGKDFVRLLEYYLRKPDSHHPGRYFGYEIDRAADEIFRLSVEELVENVPPEDDFINCCKVTYRNCFVYTDDASKVNEDIGVCSISDALKEEVNAGYADDNNCCPSRGAQ